MKWSKFSVRTQMLRLQGSLIRNKVKVLTVVFLLTLTFTFHPSTDRLHDFHKTFKDATSVRHKEIVDATSVRHEEKKDPIQIALIACKDNNPSEGRGKWNNLLNLIQVMLKSVSLLTSEPIYIHTITNSTNDYEDIVDLTKNWSSTYRDRIVFKNYKAFYPKGFENLINLFGKCVSLPLFLSDNLPGVDAVIKIDADVIFHQPPRDLWDHFYNFDHTQVAGVVPSLHSYNEPAMQKVPSFGLSGMNGGVVLYNLTRLRQFPGGWLKSIAKVIKKYPDSTNLGDQNILNALFSEGGEKYAYEIGCEWNYRWKVCAMDRNRCSNAAAWGVGIFHGAGQVFLEYNKERMIRAVFNGWSKYQLGNPVGELVSILEDELEKAKKKKKEKCARIPNIKEIFLKGLKKHLASLPRN